MPKNEPPAKPVFTPIAKVGCIHVTVEALYDIENVGEINELLEHLRQYGAAEVVAKEVIGESYDDAVQILNKRKL